MLLSDFYGKYVSDKLKMPGNRASRFRLFIFNKNNEVYYYIDE